MDQSCVAQVCIYLSGDHTNFGQSQPQSNILGSIAHEQGHFITFLIAQADEQVGNLIGEMVDLLECPLFILIIEHYLGWKTASIALEHFGN